MNDAQLGMSVAISRESLDFQAGMIAGIIQGSLSGGQDQQESVLRAQALALEGIGGKVDTVV